MASAVNVHHVWCASARTARGARPLRPRVLVVQPLFSFRAPPTDVNAMPSRDMARVQAQALPPMPHPHLHPHRQRWLTAPGSPQPPIPQSGSLSQILPAGPAKRHSCSAVRVCHSFPAALVRAPSSCLHLRTASRDPCLLHERRCARHLRGTVSCQVVSTPQSLRPAPASAAFVHRRQGQAKLFPASVARCFQ